MQCVFRAFDHTEAEIVADLLRVEGCPAYVFENGLSRLEWYRVIAFGGARVMVSNERCDKAIRIISCWQRGDYSLDGDDDRCPHCGDPEVEENPNHRGWAFVLGGLLALPLFPMLKRRKRCRACSYRWKAQSSHSYGELAGSQGGAGG